MKIQNIRRFKRMVEKMRIGVMFNYPFSDQHRLEIVDQLVDDFHLLTCVLTDVVLRRMGNEIDQYKYHPIYTLDKLGKLLDENHTAITVNHMVRRGNGVFEFEGSPATLIKAFIERNTIYGIVDDLMLSLGLPASQATSVKKIIMSGKEYNTKIKRKICSKKDGEISCPLSMEKIKRGQTIAITECGHKFKSKELRVWLTKKCVKPTCPMCRKNLKA